MIAIKNELNGWSRQYENPFIMCLIASHWIPNLESLIEVPPQASVCSFDTLARPTYYPIHPIQDV